MLNTIQRYMNVLQSYSKGQLKYKESSETWSIGQLYDHVIEVALEYISHVETCAQSSELQSEGKTVAGEEVFKEGQFPPIKIKLPNTPEFTPDQPDSIVTIIDRLHGVQKKLIEWKDKVNDVNPAYKVKHDGFGWLSAREWYDLVDMHFRHHLRQMAELDQNLQTNHIK